ncbi:DoxX family protein [Opitutus sp. ER46]|uniref:DoxX family protein n=1 Tax=Opitutus sp. ER46 TaxID=2161864 RepID=UPI000D313FF2|nr:DoxX family protein [Opitutus sp. ER46]PTY00536.1 DoxX family protein [Opitutus sp. ER46]
MKFLHFSFIPRSADLALLVLRAWFGLSLMLLHGWGKVSGFSAMAAKFPDPLHLGSASLSLGMATFAEFVCAGLVVLGLFTRFAALGVMITMGVAFWLVHGHQLTGPASGEMAFLYLGVFLPIFVGGPGKYSIDAAMGVK